MIHPRPPRSRSRDEDERPATIELADGVSVEAGLELLVGRSLSAMFPAGASNGSGQAT